MFRFFKERLTENNGRFEDGNRPVKRRRALQECTPPRNSWLQTRQDDEARGEAGIGFALDLENEHRIDRFAHASENSNWIAFSILRGGSRPQVHSFLFLLSIVRRKRNDSVPVSTM
jgi:hypothetical protein